jgi:hypothetical protein
MLSADGSDFVPVLPSPDPTTSSAIAPFCPYFE